MCFSGQDWWCHNRAHSDFQLMLRVARDRPVLLVNSIGMRVPTPGTDHQPGPPHRCARRRAWPGSCGGPWPTCRTSTSSPRCRCPCRREPPGAAVNATLRAGAGRLACRRLGIRRPAVMVTLPTAWDVVRRMDHGRWSTTAPTSTRRSPRPTARPCRALELDLLRQADMVEYVSRQLMEEERAPDRGSGPLPRPRRRPRSLPASRGRCRARRPAGHPAPAHRLLRRRSTATRSTSTLLERVARELPRAQLVLVGDADRPTRDRSPSSPTCTGSAGAPTRRSRRYGSGFDVAIMPWLDNEWIRYANPIKLKEYLALGLPVVTTTLAEAEPYRELLTIAGDGDAFVAGIRAVLAGHGPSSSEARRAAGGRCLLGSSGRRARRASGTDHLSSVPRRPIDARPRRPVSADRIAASENGGPRMTGMHDSLMDRTTGSPSPRGSDPERAEPERRRRTSRRLHRLAWSSSVGTGRWS